MKLAGRSNRHRRIRKKVIGDERPRLVVFRSGKHIYAQLVNDRLQKVIAGCSTLSEAFKKTKRKPNDREAAKEVGKLIAQKAKELGIESVRFDRAGYKYHGRIRALAEAGREAGLKF